VPLVSRVYLAEAVVANQEMISQSKNGDENEGYKTFKKGI
jgi:hypothetical protein